MRADICDPNDSAAVARFRAALETLGAEPIGHEWAIDVDLWRYRIGAETLNVFADAWSVDIEGPAELVQRVVRAVGESRA